MNNAELARVFERIALILDLKGDDNPFRIRAYERAVQTISQSRYELQDIYAAGGIAALQELPGIGKEIALKIEELLQTGKLAYLDQMKRTIPPGLFDILDVEGMGPKRTTFVWKTFKVSTLDELEKLARGDVLRNQKGWGKKSVEKIIANIALQKNAAGRLPYDVVKPVADRIVAALKRTKLCKQIEVAGSLRRKQATVGDIDILVTSTSPEKIMQRFCTLPDVATIHGQGPTKSSVALSIGIDADLRIVDPISFGAALQYFTGSKDHNVKLRKLAIRKGFTISEYGVHRGSAKHKGALVASKTEQDVYAVLGLPWIPPEARLDRGEIEAAQQGQSALDAFLTRQ